MDDVVLRLDRLVVGYGQPVCPPVSLTLRPGQVLAVVGANGAGKSTVLRTVVGLIDPLDGEVEVLGLPVDERSAHFRTGVAVDLGDDAFFPSLTVREHLLLTCLGHGVDHPDEVVDDLLDEFGLSGRVDVLPSALSSGQRRRLLLASALARPRSLLVLDEPEQRLDAGMRDRLVERLVAEREDGGAVVVVTHDPAVVGGAATRALVLTEEISRLCTPADAVAAIRDL